MEMPSVQRSTFAPLEVHILRLVLDINSTRPPTANDHEPDLADVVDYEDAMRDDGAPGLGETENHKTKEVQKAMPKAAPFGAKLDSALARQLRGRKALDAAIKLQEDRSEESGRCDGGNACGQR